MTREEALAELRSIRGSRRSEYDRWENCGVEGWLDNTGHWSRKRWALPIERARTWEWRGRDMLAMIEEVARQAAAHADEQPAVVSPWDEWVPRIPRAGMMSIAWAHRPSPDWTVPSGWVASGTGSDETAEVASR